MASTYSPDLRIELIGTGDQAGNWGSTTNTNLGTLIEKAIVGVAAVSVVATPQALTAANGLADQARQATLVLTTTTTANFSVLAPPTPKQYVVYNNTAYVATLGNATAVNGTTPTGGATITVAAGKIASLWTDGTNFFGQNTVAGDVTLAGVQTLTNKTLAFAANTLTGVASTGANTFTGAQILSDQRLSRSLLIDTGYPVLDKGNSGTATQTYDYTQGSIQTATATGSHTVAFSNFPPTGNLGELLFILTNGGAFTVTWPGSILWMKPDGTTTSSISVYLAANSGRTALQTSGVDQFFFWTRNAGTTVYGKLI
jgi:hypothetical protein